MKRERISTMVRTKRGEVWLVQFPYSDLTKNQASLASQPVCQAEREAGRTRALRAVEERKIAN
jgi:hypothetical protein